MLYGFGGSQHDRRFARQHAAIAMRDGKAGVPDLPFAAFAAKLARGFHQQEQAIHARMHAGQAAAIGVERQPAARRDMAARDEASAFPLGQKPRSSRNRMGVMVNAS